MNKNILFAFALGALLLSASGVYAVSETNKHYGVYVLGNCVPTIYEDNDFIKVHDFYIKLGIPFVEPCRSY